MEGEKLGGPGTIVVVAEVLLGKKPTYGHGNVTKLFNI